MLSYPQRPEPYALGLFYFMADFQIPDKGLLTSVDRAADSFLVYDADALSLKRTTTNYALDLSSHPVGISDIQTLTNKTLTSPTIASPVLSGTVTGTYTLGGAPTFPASVVTLTASQTLTNKTLTGPTITSPTITNPTLAVDTISEFTATNGVTVDGVLLKDSKMNGSYITDATVTHAQLTTGVPVQVVSTNYSAVATGTTTIPRDDTIPQITEGTEFMTQTITPKSATNELLIEVILYATHSTTNQDTIIALFQDATANALAAIGSSHVNANAGGPINLKFRTTAASTTARTYKVRAGSTNAGTLTFNGTGGTRLYGGVCMSNITITEYKA